MRPTIIEGEVGLSCEGLAGGRAADCRYDRRQRDRREMAILVRHDNVRHSGGPRGGSWRCVSRGAVRVSWCANSRRWAVSIMRNWRTASIDEHAAECALSEGGPPAARAPAHRSKKLAAEPKREPARQLHRRLERARWSSIMRPGWFAGLERRGARIGLARPSYDLLRELFFPRRDILFCEKKLLSAHPDWPCLRPSGLTSDDMRGTLRAAHARGGSVVAFALGAISIRHRCNRRRQPRPPPPNLIHGRSSAPFCSRRWEYGQRPALRPRPISSPWPCRRHRAPCR